MDFFGIKKKLEEGFGSLVGNIGNLFNQGARTVGGVANNVLQQARPVANQVAQNWQQAQNAGGNFNNSLRQQAQNLTNQAINATVRETSNLADNLGYSKQDQFNDSQKFLQGDLSSIANPLKKGLQAGTRTTTAANPLSIGGGLAAATVESAQGKEFNPLKQIDRVSDFQRGIYQQGVNVLANVPSGMAVADTWVYNNTQVPVYRAIVGDENTNKITAEREAGNKALYGVSNFISDSGKEIIKKQDENSIYSKTGDIAGQTAIGLGASALGPAALPFWYTQAMGRVGRETYNETGDLGKASTTAMLYAPAEAALEKIGSARVLSPAGIDIAKGGLRQTAREAAKGFLSEGSTEAAQQFAENVTKNKVYNPQQGLMEGVPESFVIGGLVGGGLRGANTGGNYRAEKTAFQNQLDQELQNLNNTVTDPTSNINPEEQTQVSTPQQIQPQATQPIQTPQAPQAPQVGKTDLSKYGWTAKETTNGLELTNRNGKTVATIKTKNGRHTAIHTDGTKIASRGGSLNSFAEDVATKYFYASAVKPTQTAEPVGGTLRPDKAKYNTKEEFYLADIQKLAKKYGKLNDDPDRNLARLADKHFDELDPETQRYLEFEASGTDFESSTIPQYRGFANADPDSSGATVHGSQIYELRQAVDELRSAPQDSQLPQPVQQPQVTQPMNEADTQQLQNTQREITRSQPLSGQPESISQLLQNKQIPQENVANQQALGEAKVQAQDLANLYKMDPATAQRLIENYGYANVAALAQEVSKSGTARSVDAVVVSEAVKRWGKPRSQMTDAELASLDQTPEAQQANTVATQPTQTVPQEQQPVMDAEAQSYVANQLPADSNLSPAKIVDTSTGEVTSRDQVIANADRQMRNFIDTKILPAIEGQPFTAEQFTREIQEADRNGTNPSPAVARFYDKNIAPLIKAMARNAKREDVLKRRWYLPQFKAGQEQQINVGGSLVNKIDVDEFGFAKARENKIPLDKLDYSFDGLVRLAVQEAAYKARHTIRASEVVNTQAERGIEITEKQAEKVSRLEESTAKELNKNAEDPGQLEKTDILGRMKILGKAQNETQRVLDKGMFKIDRLTDSRDNLLTRAKYTDSAGNETDIYQGMGFYLFDRAEGVGHQVFSELYTVDDNDVITSSPSFEQTVDRLQAEYADVNLPQGVKDQIIQDFAFKSSNTVDTTSVDTSVKREAFVRLQKRMARELLSQELKTVDVQNKQLYKLLNGESQRVLMQDNFERTLGEKIINATTGTFYRGYLALNPRSALMQLLEINRLQALLGPKLAAHGVKMAAQDLNITKKYGIRETRFEDVNEFKNSDNTSRGIQIKDKASNVLMYMFNKGEQIKDAAFLHALEADADAKGLTSTDKTRYVLDNFHKYAIKYGQEGSIGINKTKSGRLLFQFLQFGIKSTRIRLSKVVDIVGPDRTSQTRRQAGAYLARDAAGSAALYLIMSAAIGATWEEMMGYFNPFEDRNTDKNKSTAEAVVGVIPGGPLTSSLKNIYFAMMQEARAAEKEGRPVNPENYINTQVKKNIAGLIPGGHQLINKTGVQALLPDGSTVKEFFKDQGAISDMQRGYNQSPTGRARFISPETPQDIAKALIFGQYSTGPAREYFGSQNVAGDLEIAKKLGVDWIGPRDNNFPVGDRFQKKIDAGENPGSVIIRSRAYDKKKEDFKDSNPAQQAILNEINKTTYNPATGKNESDVISPEKWDKVNSDTSLKLFERLREKAIDDNREFGYAIDPIYTLTDPQQIREILKIRSLPTGDDTELKQMNTAKHKWYRDFADKEKAYFETIKAKNFEESDEYGPTERKKAYIDSGSQYPQHTDLVKRYFDIKEKDANAGKEFYKNNRDQLAKDFDANKKAAFEWTNKRRALEGAQPLTWEAFNNVTFGYEDDEAKVFKQLGFKLGEFGSGSDKGYNAYRKAKSFSQPTIRIAAPKPGALKVPKPNVKKANYKVPKIVVRRSKA